MFMRPQSPLFSLPVQPPATLENRTQGMPEVVMDTTDNNGWEGDLRKKEQEEKSKEEQNNCLWYLIAFAFTL